MPAEDRSGGERDTVARIFTSSISAKSKVDQVGANEYFFGLRAQKMDQTTPGS